MVATNGHAQQWFGKARAITSKVHIFITLKVFETMSHADCKASS